MKQLEKLNILEIKELILKKELKVVDCVNYFIERIQKFGLKNHTNAICSINQNAVNEANRLDELIKNGLDLPLLGIPYVVKDNIDVKGMVTSAGSIILKDNIALSDSVVVKRLKAAGAICIGKANMMELANYIGDIPDGYSSYGGKVICGYGEEFPVGGSSSGSAVAVTIGLAPFSLGTDTSYSVVACAGLNGVIGFKPNAKKISNIGVVPITSYLDSVGVFTKNIIDLKLVLNILINLRSYPKINNFNLGIDECKKENLSNDYYEVLKSFIEKLNENGINTTATYFSNQDYIYELMKRDYAISFNNYLNKSNSSIKSFEELVLQYKNNSFANKYGISILEKSLEYFKEKNNCDKISEILKTIKREKRSFFAMLSKYDAVIETGRTSSIHVFNVPSISIPFIKEENKVPYNIIIYSRYEDKLLQVAEKIYNLINKNIIYDILDEYKGE